MPLVRIQHEPFDIGVELARLMGATPAIGALASFVGLVRDVNEASGVYALTLEHYPGMTERALETIVGEAAERWSIIDATVIHRVGTLEPTEGIVLVAVASAHRGDAFAACEFIMDFLKTRAPFWKKEASETGERWVAARESDEAAAARWAKGGRS